MPATMTPTHTAGTPSVPAVEKVFSILEVLAHSDSGLTLRELAHICGIPKSSVHGIIVTLQRCGYLCRNCRTNRYLFARKLLMLANAALGSLELRDRAENHLYALARRTGLAVHLAIVEFSEVVIVAKFDLAFEQRSIPSWVGKRLDLHCTSLGKALMMHWSEAAIDEYARNRTLSRHNDNTICSLRRLKEELDRSRRLGFAVDDEEDILGYRCIGVPVSGPKGDTVAAISVSGLITEIAEDTIASLAANVRQTALQITASLISR